MTATLTLAEPATATLLGVLILSERLTVPGLIGIALVAASVVALSLPSRKAPSVTPSSHS
jgi:DME family drug/metabolite transporter